MTVTTMQPTLVTMPNVELLEVGEDWETSTGIFTFTHEDLVAAVASQDDPAIRTPVIKLGHVDPRFDGQPSFGRIENMHLSENGQTLLGDLVGLPLWLAQVMWTAYPRRSIEGRFDASTRTGNNWQFILTGLALLGDAYPAIDTLEDVQLLWGPVAPELLPVDDVVEIAASGSTFRARKVEDNMPDWLKRNAPAQAAATVHAALSLDAVRRAYYESPDCGAWWWIREVRVNPLQLIVDDDEGGLFRVDVTIDASDNITFATPSPVKIEYVAASGTLILDADAAAGQIVVSSHSSPADTGRTRRVEAGPPGTVPSEEAPQQDREGDVQLSPENLASLGLAATATDEEINAALTARLAQATSEPPTEEPAPEPTPLEPVPEPEAEPAPEAEPVAPTEEPGVPVPEGMVLVDQAQWAAVQEGVAAAHRLEAEQATRTRDAILDDAVRAGKFPPSRREHYTALFAADPDGTRNLISALQPGVIPVEERGSASSDGDAIEAAAYPDTWKSSVMAAQKGVQTSRVKVVGD